MSRVLQFTVVLLLAAIIAEDRSSIGQGVNSLPPMMSGLEVPRLLRRVDPVYPPEAVKDGAGGDVILMVTIAADGTLHDLKAQQGLPQLIPAAVHAVSQWQYEPPRVNGVVTPVRMLVILHFWIKPVTIGTADSAERGISVSYAVPGRLPPPPAVPEGVLRISATVMDNLLQKRIDPTYPTEAIGLGAVGTVKLAIVVTEEGKVSDVQVLAGPERFRDAAVTAVRQWEYKPYSVGGEVRSVQTTVTLNFAAPR